MLGWLISTWAWAWSLFNSSILLLKFEASCNKTTHPFLFRSLLSLRAIFHLQLLTQITDWHMKLISMFKLLLGTHLTAHSFINCAPFSSSSIKSAPSCKRVVVIGGGAAGYFSAIECAKVLNESQAKGKDSRNIRYEVIELRLNNKSNQISIVDHKYFWLCYQIVKIAQVKLWSEMYNLISSQIVVLEAGQKPLTKVLISGLIS